MGNKTDNANEVGKHAFQVAGLGLAPFRCIGMTENAIKYPDGHTQAGGTCAYCGTGIRFECVVQSADKKRFTVGTDCINKVGDTGLLKAYKSTPEYRQHQRKLRAARNFRNHEEAHAHALTLKTQLEKCPHPYGFKDRETNALLTAWDYLDFCMGNRGWTVKLVNVFAARTLASNTDRLAVSAPVIPAPEPLQA